MDTSGVGKTGFEPAKDMLEQMTRVERWPAHPLSHRCSTHVLPGMSRVLYCRPSHFPEARPAFCIAVAFDGPCTG